MWVKHCSKWQACCSWGGKVAWKLKNNPNIIDSCEFYSPEHCESVGVLPAGVQAGKQQVERQEDLNLLNPLVARVGSRSFHKKKKKIKTIPNNQDQYSWMVGIVLPLDLLNTEHWLIFGAAINQTHLFCCWRAFLPLFLLFLPGPFRVWLIALQMAAQDWPTRELRG